MLISTKRIAPGEGNTWFIKVHGTEFSAEFSTKYPKTLRTMTYQSGKPQAWETIDIGYAVAVPDHHRRHLRVRLLRQHPADVRGVLRRAGARRGGDAAAVLLRRRPRRRTSITGF